MTRLAFAIRVCSLVFLSATLTPRVSAQVIGLKTVPLAAGDPFLIFPSQNLGMGAASFALQDALADPFANPAAGVRTTDSLTDRAMLGRRGVGGAPGHGSEDVRLKPVKAASGSIRNTDRSRPLNVSEELAEQGLFLR